jgi:hypothetical protein
MHEGAGCPHARRATEAQQWLAKEELADRKNARVIDKVMLALPKELGKEQRAALVEAFAERITQGKASWLGAIHDRGKDGANPHCHLVIRDRDVATGKAVARLSAGPRDRKKAGLEPNSTEYLRKIAHAIRMLARVTEALSAYVLFASGRSSALMTTAQFDVFEKRDQPVMQSDGEGNARASWDALSTECDQYLDGVVEELVGGHG